MSEITLDRLEVASQFILPNALMRSMSIEKVQDRALRATAYSFSAWFTSNKIHEEERETYRALTWRERIAVLFGKPVVVAVKVEMRHNCPHIEAAPQREHIDWMIPR